MHKVSNIIMLQNKNNPSMKKKENLSKTNYKKMCIDEILTFITFYLLIKFRVYEFQIKSRI